MQKEGKIGEKIGKNFHRERQEKVNEKKKRKTKKPYEEKIKNKEKSQVGLAKTKSRKETDKKIVITTKISQKIVQNRKTNCGKDCDI